MTTMFGLNSANDIYINSAGLLDVQTGQTAVETACQTASKMRLGEAILQTGLGLPMLEAIFNGVPQPAIYENALRTALQAIDGVVKVTVLQLTAEKGIFNYSATIESEYGQTYLLNG